MSSEQKYWCFFCNKEIPVDEYEEHKDLHFLNDFGITLPETYKEYEEKMTILGLL